MASFTDKAKITLISGKGGDGHVSFRREKFVPNGGPDGGDGGKGGSIIFKVDKGMTTLEEYRGRGKYKAQPGEDGKKKNMTGHAGEDLILKVPEGTVIKDYASGKVIADMSGDNLEYMILRGGKGGLGNQHFASSTMQAPKYAQPGESAKELDVLLELKVIADVGLVGFPSVGKSTLLSVVSNAKPKIAAYHFTTLQPILGVVDLPDANGFVMADIPGLIEGAADGAGLGHDFLAHIERCRMLIHMVDAAGTEGRDPLEDIEAINNELRRYNIDLTGKKQVIAANKVDVIDPEHADETDPENPVRRIREKYEPLGFKVFPISAAANLGVREMLYYISSELQTLPKESEYFVQEFNPETDLVTNEGEGGIEITYDAKQGEYHVEGPKVEKMLAYTNLDTEKGLAFLQRFMRENQINERLEAMGCQDGDTVKLFGHTFEYYT